MVHSAPRRRQRHKTKPSSLFLSATFRFRTYSWLQLKHSKLHQPWPILSFHTIITIPSDLPPSQGPLGPAQYHSHSRTERERALQVLLNESTIPQCTPASGQSYWATRPSKRIRQTTAHTHRDDHELAVVWARSCKGGVSEFRRSQ
jgi:hypothetical protein